jgi:hypothetical protein
LINIKSFNSQCNIGYQGGSCEPILNTAFDVKYTGSNQNYIVPSNVNLLFVKLWGAGGGGSKSHGTEYGGGGSGFASCFLSVTPGVTLNIMVGGGGECLSSGNGSYGGGGAQICNPAPDCLGTGGGRSAIQSSSGDIATAGIINTNSNSNDNNNINTTNRRGRRGWKMLNK